VDAHETCDVDGWCRIDLPVDGLRSVWGASRDDVWIGATDAVVHWDGKGWSKYVLPSAAPEVIVSLAGAGSADVDALAVDGTGTHSPALWHWDGHAWTLAPFASVDGSQTTLRTVWVSAAGERWVSGDTDTSLVAFHGDGADWSKEVMFGGWHSNQPNSFVPFLRGMWGGSTNDLWFTGGYNGVTLFRREGTTWTYYGGVGYDEILHAAWGSAAYDVWAVGGYLRNTEGPLSARMYHFDGGAWNLIDLGEAFFDTRELSCVYGSAADDVWASGAVDPDLLHWDGTAWSLAHRGGAYGLFVGLWTDGHDVIAVSNADSLGEDIHGSAIVRHSTP
jgi:hypothetical protein